MGAARARGLLLTGEERLPPMADHAVSVRRKVAQNNVPYYNITILRIHIIDGSPQQASPLSTPYSRTRRAKVKGCRGRGGWEVGHTSTEGPAEREVVDNNDDRRNMTAAANTRLLCDLVAKINQHETITIACARHAGRTAPFRQGTTTYGSANISTLEPLLSPQRSVASGARRCTQRSQYSTVRTTST